MTTRHITLSAQGGMITELELMGKTYGAGERYVLRYHKSDGAEGAILNLSVPDSSMPWSGFRYRNHEISILLLRQGRSSAAA